jgi:hypothetical protein
MTQQPKVFKTLVLKRCYLPDGFNSSLEKIVDGIKGRLPNHEDRVFRPELFKSYLIADITRRSNSESGIYVSILCQDKGATGLINFEKSKETAEVEEHEAPENRAWLENQILLYIVDNHVVCCNLGPRDNFLGTMIKDLAKKAEAVNDDFNFRISDVPNKTELERVNNIGVKEIDLSLTSYLSTFDNFRSATGSSGIMPVLERVFGQPDSISRLRKRASAKGSLKLTRGGKFKKDEIPKDEWLTDIGATIIEQDLEDYKILLEDGTAISSSNLKVMRSVKLNRHANTFSVDDAKIQTAAFYDELKNDGSLSW